MDHRTNIRALVLLCALACAACRGGAVSTTPPVALPTGTLELSEDFLRSGQVQIEPVSVASEAIMVRTSGKAGFNEERLSYVSSPLAGRVVSVAAHAGDHVDAGQPLAVIDSPDLGAASSEFIKARADLILAERTHKLAADLLAAKATAAKDFQKAEDEYVKAKADLRRTRERLLSLGVPESQLDGPLEALHVRSQFNLTAPISGTVVERTVTLGQMVGGDAPQRLFVIADLNTLWVTADIYEKDLSRIRVGEEVSVQAAAWPGEEFRGRIDYVGDTVDPNSRTIKVRLTVDNQPLRLKPEMFVTATVHTSGSATVLTVPVAAVHGEGTGQAYVFAAVDGTHFVRRAVTLGAKTNDRVAILDGLSPDARVVTAGSILLKAEADRQANS
jgi:cobalt-zinc-cadmium efflux system membrane fusion protein